MLGQGPDRLLAVSPCDHVHQGFGDWLSAVPSGLNPGSASWSCVTLASYSASLGLVSFRVKCTVVHLPLGCWQNHKGGKKAGSTEQVPAAPRWGASTSSERGFELY